MAEKKKKKNWHKKDEKHQTGSNRLNTRTPINWKEIVSMHGRLFLENEPANFPDGNECMHIWTLIPHGKKGK